MQPNHPDQSIRIAELIRKFQRKELSQDERGELMMWTNASRKNKKMFNDLLLEKVLESELNELEATGTSRSWRWIEENIDNKEAIKEFKRIRRRRLLSYASVIMVLVGISAYLWVYNNKGLPGKQLSGNINATDVLAPIKNRATLILSDGRKVILDSIVDGGMIRQGDAEAVKMANGQLKYELVNGALNNSDITAYHTIVTPRGSQYQVVLPDGSQVWLNAESSLRYPTVFGGKEREVELHGEAYFDIAVNSKQPFKLKTGEVNINVLGTSFNVTAYPEEQTISTTLISGKVLLQTGEGEQMLKPGQRANWQKAARKLKMEDKADLETIIAWKKDLFVFKRAALSDVMRELERWYDIKVDYHKGIDKEDLFTGEVNRDGPISLLFKEMETTKIARFQINNKTVTVLPYISDSRRD